MLMNIPNKQNKTPSLDGNCIESKRAELKAYFKNAWQTYDALFSLIITDEAFYLKPERLRHPLIFYFGHTATFYINKLILGKYINKRINPEVEAICAVGVDEMSWDDLDSEHYHWPSVDEVRYYRQSVFKCVEQLIDTMTITFPIEQDSLAWILLMGAEHERIHIETSSVIMRMLPLEYLSHSEHHLSQWPTCPDTDTAPENTLLTVSAQQVDLGKPSTDRTYGWDNEYGQNTLKVEAFNAAQYLVSNQEFQFFVEAGGYQHLPYWTEEGQQWLSFSKAEMPRFWLKRSGQYFQRNLLTEIPLPLDWPVEVNYLEAKAFCAWKTKQSKLNIRLPTEAEWYCLRDKITSDLPDWQKAPGNINLEYFASPCPVNRFEQDGFFDITGNVWQWTESAIDGFNGFKVHPLYDDFSTPTFDGKHNVIKGGSWISTGNEAIKHSRYAFRRHFFQHAGFRYVQSENQTLPLLMVNPFESNEDVCQQLDSHYGNNKRGQEMLFSPNSSLNYALRISEQVKKYASFQAKGNQGRILDLGCSVGRVSFELSTLFEHVDGVDFSARYIQHCVQLQQNKAVRYSSVAEGEVTHFHEVTLDSLNKDEKCQTNKHYHTDKIYFSQGDGCNLKAQFCDYDVILIQHNLENSYRPRALLSALMKRIAPNGLLMVLSDYGFDEKITEKKHWLGGQKINGENQSGFEALSLHLSDSFTLLNQEELPRIIKQDQRHFSLALSHLTIWQANQ
jgi:5-histidylcysteine sulfoxide synthase/putative 4-mercaptohistidine N1-methyltranferase